MPTRTESRSSSSSRNQSRSAFSWGDHAGALIGAAVAGAGVAIAANFGRKLAIQGMEARAGDWDEMLAQDHDEILKIFDSMLATDSSQTFKRGALLMKLGHKLDKHSYEEESVVYPALREDNEAATSDKLNMEHGVAKSFLFELKKKATDAPDWLETVREFRDTISKHMEMEEQEVFPSFKKDMSEEQNAAITAMVNKAGFMMA